MDCRDSAFSDRSICISGVRSLEKIPRYTYGKPGRAIASDNQDLK